MDLPTYTNIWRIEKRLYKLYDFRLPMPLPVGTFGVAMGIFLIWVVLLSVLNAPFDFGNGWHLVLWVVPPGVITVLATRPVIEGKRLTELLISYARFFTEPRVMTRLAPEYEPGEVRVSVRVWHRSADAGPLPLPLPRRHRAEAEHGTEGTHEAQEAGGAADAPPLRGVAGPAKAAPVRAESLEELYTPAETDRTARSGSVADGAAEPDETHEAAGAGGSARTADEDGLQEPSGAGHRDEQDPGAGQPPEHEGPSEPDRPRARERVPAFAAAAPVHGAAPEEPSSAAAAPASAVHEEYQEADPHSSTRAAGDPGPGQGRRGVGRKMLNYFGFALEPGSAEPSGGGSGRGSGDGAEEAGSSDRPGESGRHGEYGEHDEGGGEGFDGFEEEPVFITEEDEDRDRDAWFASLRASSGHTPVGLTSKSAYTAGDTGPMSSAELAEAAGDPGRDEASRTQQESAPARRLRGRTQGIRVVRELDERRSGTERLEASEAPEQEREQAPERDGARGSSAGQGRVRGAGDGRAQERASDHAVEHAPERVFVEPAPERRRAQGQGQALPAEAAPPEASATGVPEAPGQPRTSKRRPHAAPWELDRGRERGTSAKDREGPQERESRRERQGWQGTSGGAERSDGSDFSDLSDYAARYAAATGRPTADTPQTPWLPPASDTPTEEGTEQRASHEEPVAHEPRAEDRGEERAAQAGSASEPGSAPGQNTDSEPGSGAAAGEAGPALELDHGTGEHDAMPLRRYEDPDARGPEWSEHMSVLDRHLSKADTPAPPRPEFADAVPGNEREPEQSGTAWFEDGEDNHPDRPRAGDRGNPVISARDLRERDRGAEETEGTDGAEGIDRADGAAGTDETTGDAEPKDTEPAEPVGGEEDSSARPDATDTAVPTEDPGTAEPTDTRDTAEPTEDPGTAVPKPPTQLDHGTGELASFSEVRGDRSASTATPDTPHRRTADELERAEARALEERRHAASARSGTDHGSQTSDEPRGAVGPRPSEEPRSSTETGPVTDGGRASARELSSTGPEGAPAEDHGPGTAHRAENPGAPASHPRANPSLAALAHDRHSTEDRATDSESHDGPGTGSGASDASDGSDPAEDPHEGVFHRVAQNARRLGQLFVQPSPDEDPDSPERETKPALELDHGTGEQERLGDTPNGVPAQRPDRTDRTEARPDSGGTRGWRRLARVVTGGSASPIRSDLPDGDIERLRTPLPGPRNLVVLGCTGGAGQTVTGLMIGHTLAAHRDDRVVAVDVNPGPNGLSRRVGAQTPETLTALLANADGVQDYEQMRSYVSRAPTGLEIVQTLDDPYVQTLDDRDYGQLAGLLGGFYGVTLMDPAATGVSRALPGADGLVLVAPASADAERAVSMTFEWLDGNGYSSLRTNSVLVVNGVSKRSLPDVDAAERVARGRCRAIVRVPWDDHLGASYTRIDVGALRSATKRAHGALGGVLVRGLTD
ncbi:TcpE family conjugal transfer membrane protein [Nocardiopsis xinjiangensis]|uniref:TcpE family conjugal transfer membrane protein n=1 Tax=Nocardiopsis xinjiangensis TaxID=124285 RepID=UPI000349D26C|nr:TcpE family conjugal transfer membrane protein [Nocardiopsis xinjiangensis]